jgi:hypothetical protein
MSLYEPEIYADKAEFYVEGAVQRKATEGERVARALSANANATLAVAAALQQIARAIAAQSEQ